MRHLLIISFLITHYTALGQFPKDEKTGKVIYTGVVELPGTDKQTIYNQAKLWVVSTLKSGDNMVELEGSNSDQIIGTGNLVLDSIFTHPKYPNSILPDVTLNFKFLVFCKDGRLKYSVENFLMTIVYGGQYNKTSLESLEPPPQFGLKESNIVKWKLMTTNYVDRQIRTLIADFERSMKAQKDKDW